MVKEIPTKKKAAKTISVESIRAMYYTGKVKPSLNKIASELENDPENLDFLLLACQCLARTKGYDQLATYADTAIKIAPENPNGYFYKGIAFKNIKGKEQEALKNFNEALSIDAENTLYLKSKAETHLLLYTDYHLPIQFAEKHRVKAEECLLKVIEIVEGTESPTFNMFLTAGDVSMLLTQTLDGKKYFIKAVNAFEAAEEIDQDKNIYKDIIKAQKACIKIAEKFTE